MEKTRICFFKEIGEIFFVDDVCNSNSNSNSNSIYRGYVSYRKFNSIEPTHWENLFLWMIYVTRICFLKKF